MTQLTPILLAVLAAQGEPPVLQLQGQRLTVHTATVEAVFDGPALISAKPVAADVEFIHERRPASPLDLFFLNGETVGQDKLQEVSVEQLSDRAARITVSGADSQRSLLVAADADTDDIRLIPDGICNRRGLRAVGWRVSVHPEAEVILPIVNGMRVRSDSTFPGAGRFAWPFKWEAQLAIAQRDGHALMIHSQDRAYQFKALRLGRDGDRTELCFETEPPGSLWDQRTAGGVEWRLNIYPGNWKAPAARYRDWMTEVYELPDKRAHRPAWTDRVTLAVCWMGSKVEMLDALADVHPPEQTLIHLSGWRTEKYDVNYPDYTPSEQDLAFMARANEMGFHVMPHFNYFAVYYQHPFYQEVRDFQLRSPDKNEPQGWHWPPKTHDYTRMGYIHPGLGIWRQKLMDVILGACRPMGTDVAFLDQTLCTWNTDNALVQGMTTVEGMRRIQEELAAVRPDLVLAGEGLHEISFQRQAFAQAHIHDGWGELRPEHVEAAHPINAFLWSDHTRLIGYYHLRPGEEGYELGAEVYRRMNALPTIITNNPRHLREPSETTRQILERARGLQAAETAPVP